MKVREFGDEEWQDASEYSKSRTEKFVAEDFAKYTYNQDPCDPKYFDLTVEVLNDNNEIKTFAIKAEQEVHFSVIEGEE